MIDEYPKVEGFQITGRHTGKQFFVRAGDTLQVEFNDGLTGKREVVLKEILTETGFTDDIFIARAKIDGKPAKKRMSATSARFSWMLSTGRLCCGRIQGTRFCPRSPGSEARDTRR